MQNLCRKEKYVSNCYYFNKLLSFSFISGYFFVSFFDTYVEDRTINSNNIFILRNLQKMHISYIIVIFVE
jgi:hypothetical protein